MTDKTHPDVPFRVWHRGGACVDVAHERDQALVMAALWKETTREHVGRSRTALSWAEMCKESARTANARAIKAERERDEARGALRARLGVLAESRPLTPDAITDEMVERARNAPSFDGRLSPTPRIVREMLTAALTEPPARPEGAEEIEFLIADRLGRDVPGDVIRALADEIAERAGATRLYPEDGAA